MSHRAGRAVVLVLLFLAAQVVPGLHAALEAGHDHHSCCSHEETSAHFETCDVNHEEAHCAACDAARGPASVAADSEFISGTLVSSTPAASVDVATADPFHVDVPNPRGPPA